MREEGPCLLIIAGKKYQFIKYTRKKREKKSEKLDSAIMYFCVYIYFFNVFASILKTITGI